MTVRESWAIVFLLMTNCLIFVDDVEIVYDKNTIRNVTKDLLTTKWLFQSQS